MNTSVLLDVPQSDLTGQESDKDRDFGPRKSSSRSISGRPGSRVSYRISDEEPKEPEGTPDTPFTAFTAFDSPREVLP
eukprot:gene16077-4871_t